MYNSFLSFIIALMLTRNSSDARNYVQALIRYLQNLWLFLSAFNLTGTTTRLSFVETVTCVQHYYAFHEEASLKVQGIKGSTSQTQGPDGTLSATTLNSVKMILEGLTRLRTKYERGYLNTDTPMMLDFCLRFPRKRVTGMSYRTLKIQWPCTTFSLL